MLIKLIVLPVISPTATSAMIPLCALIVEISPFQMDSVSAAKLITAEPVHLMMSAPNANLAIAESVELLD